ncbi:Undecaprenyl pyrophosphate synthetase family protein [Perilla frutescens var. frutescens]|nr:Undecaprenyl pyrophosphate synthetase family protein [Perilla frutescens var. frutescens]
MLSSQFSIPTQMNNLFSVQSKTKREGINSSFIRFRLAGASSKCGAVGIDKERDGDQLSEGLLPELMPKHVAIIMDGNRRWARERGLPVQLGHRAGGKAMKQLALSCQNHGARVLSLFSFSTENWVRPEEEVDFLMNLLEEVTASDIHELITKDDMRVSFVGDRSRLPLTLQSVMCSAEELSKPNKGMHLCFAINYSGRYDIIEATKRIAAKVKNGNLQVDNIDDAVFQQHLDTNIIDDFPNPDLLIRTSGELRISNYMLWQVAYAEMFFCNKLFPDFANEDLVEAITAFQQRQRRYGGV